MKKGYHDDSLSEYGRGEMIRTSDPLLPKQLRYQTALRPELSDITFYLLERQGNHFPDVYY